MKIQFPDMTVDFWHHNGDDCTADEAKEHAEVIMFENIDALPAPYEVTAHDDTTNTYTVTVD